MLRDSLESSTNKNGVIRLSDAMVGGKFKLVSVEGGRCIRARLASMGLHPGAELKVLKKNGAGPLVISVKESRFMLGRGMAHKIIVK